MRLFLAEGNAVGKDSSLLHPVKARLRPVCPRDRRSLLRPYNDALIVRPQALWDRWLPYGLRHFTKLTIFMLITTSRFWFSTSMNVRTIPRSGRDSERRA